MRTTDLAAVQTLVTSWLNGTRNIVVAYSGGLDSTVLLHLLVELRKSIADLKLTALHIDHKLNVAAPHWVEHCGAVCHAWQVEYLVRQVEAKRKDTAHSPEEYARKLRYEAFAEFLPQDALLVTAHHANDQAETLLLQLFRGAGPKGLAAIPHRIKFARGYLGRPLLNYSRAELLHYATGHKLNWVEDESNNNLRFDRNFVRHQLLPLIKTHWPGIIPILTRVALNCTEASALLEHLARLDFAHIGTTNHATLKIDLLTKLDNARQNNLLRFWLRTLALPIPSRVKLDEVRRTVLSARGDANPVVSWDGAAIRRFRNHLYALAPLAPWDNRVVLPLSLTAPLKLPAALGILHPRVSGEFLAAHKDSKFTVRFRQGGERVKLSKRQGTHKLKKLMQEWQIPPWVREHIPLVYCDTTLIAVVGYYSVPGTKFVLESTQRSSSE